MLIPRGGNAAMRRAGGVMNSGPTGSLMIASRMRSISPADGEALPPCCEADVTGSEKTDQKHRFRPVASSPSRVVAPPADQ
jgi:hypothetical protein